MSAHDVHRRADRSPPRIKVTKLVPKSDGPDKLWRLNRRQTRADTGYVTDTFAVLAESNRHVINMSDMLLTCQPWFRYATYLTNLSTN